jgi:alpha-glucosidase
MKNTIRLICFIAFWGLSFPTFSKTIKLYSPDTKNEVEVNTSNQLSYSVKRNGDIILTPSALSMQVGPEKWGVDNRYTKITKSSFNEEVDFVVPRKFNHIKDSYNQLSIVYKDYNVEFRAYNDGVAYRFVGKTKNISTIDDENVQYNFAQNYLTYTLLTNKLQNWFEENYTVRQFNELPKDSFSIAPLMVDLKKYKVLLAEANLYNYSGMYLQPKPNGFSGLFAKYPKVEEFFDGTNKIYATEREDYIVKSSVKRNFPWRVMGIFDNEKDILSSELIYLLSDKADPKTDYSWIKPGKVLWDWWNHQNIYGVDFEAGINTATYMYMIDFAHKNGIEYILIDEGWSGKDDLLTLNPNVDMPKICQYANKNNVGVMLWAKWINVDKQLDASFDLMKSWDVKGVKIDFMDRNDAKMVNFFERVAKKASDCKFLIDLHGSYPNDGMLRKYPMLMTREGVLGMEYDKWSNKATPNHDVMISYIRMWGGPMDYTPGAMQNSQPESFNINQVEPMSQGTRVHQLAMYVVYESPLQMLSDSPTKYKENPECFDFLKKVPVVWDKTIPLSGNIQKNIIVARKKGNEWYIGALGGNQAQEIEIDLSFLGEGKYQMKAYRDGVNANVNGKDYKLYNAEVTSAEKIKVNLARGGGFAAVLSKQ